MTYSRKNDLQKINTKKNFGDRKQMSQFKFQTMVGGG